MKLPHWRNAPVMLAAGFTLLSVVALGLALAWRSADQQRLEEGRAEVCVNQNEIKGVLRTLVLARIRVEEAVQKTAPLDTRAEVIAEFKRQLPKLAPIAC